MSDIRLQTPLREKDVRNLNAGDRVLLNGLIHTGRDSVHKYLHDGNKAPFKTQDSVIYHCGPVIVKEENEYKVKAAGPTTSIREEPYMAKIIKKLGIRGIIGKGGMGQKTLLALKEFGAVYLHAIGGAACVYAECVEKVEGCDLEEFGVPEAIWHIRVKDMPCIVSMDAKGNSLHKIIETNSENNLRLNLGTN